MRKKVFVIFAVALLSSVFISSYAIQFVNSENDLVDSRKVQGNSVGVSTALASSVDWWPTFHHDPAHTGYSTSSAPTTSYVKWVKNLEVDGSTSAPVVVDGLVFVGCVDKIYAFNANTGALVWSYQTGMLSHPTVADGKVLVELSDGKIAALNQITGMPIWNYQTDGTACPPTAANGRVFFGVGYPSFSKICSLNVTNGAYLWSYQDYYLRSSPAPPAVADGKVFVITHLYLTVLNEESGDFMWRYYHGWNFAIAPAVAYSKVFVSAINETGTGFIVALDENTGTRIWNHTGLVFDTPAVANGKVFVPLIQGICALDATTGSHIWGYWAGEPRSSPIVAGGMVFWHVYTAYPRFMGIYANNETTGGFIWEYDTGSLNGEFAVADGILYEAVNQVTNKIYAFGQGYALTITTSMGGTTDPSPGTHIYPEGTAVSVTATPDANCAFDRWELDGSWNYSNPITVTMDSDHTLHAVFAYDVAIEAHCYTEGVDVGVNITMDDSPTGYTTPHTFTSLKGTHTFTVPSTDPQSHPFKQWNTGQTSTTITVTSAGTYTAYYQAKYTLTITTTTGGTTTPSPGTYTYWSETVVSVTATPYAGFLFDHWELDGSWGYSNPITVTMDSDHTLHAVFVPTYTLTITTTTGGTTDPSPGTHIYPEGTAVSVTATPDTGHYFDHWELDGATYTTNPISVTMDGNHTLHAVFVYDVTVDAYCNTEGVYVSVNITMDGSPTGFNTSHTFTGLLGTHTFTVPSTDANGHPFKQWNTGQTSTTITVTSAGTYTAYYQAKYTLTITTTTGGTTTPSPGTYTYWSETVVSVTATPNTGYNFDHWELDGVNVGSTNPISVTMNNDHSLHAVFTYDVTIEAYCYTESAYVSVSITMDGTPTGYNTTHTFTGLTGTHTFTVPSTDANGHPFKQWSTGETSTTITVSSGGIYTAYYKVPVHDIAVTSVTASPTSVAQGQTVTITVVVENEGDFSESFSVTAYYDNIAIDSQTVTNLSPGASQTLYFSWQTWFVPPSRYKIKATASTVPEETDTTDNTKVDGTVTVSAPSPGVGGVIIPADKLGLLAPYVGLASTLVVATAATALYAKRVKRRKEK